MADLKVTTEQHTAGQVIHLRGSADMVAAESLGKALDAIIVLHPSLVVMDLTGCSFIASLCMAELARFCQAIKGQGKIRIVLVPGHVRDVLSRSRVINMFEQADSVDAALAK